MLPQMYDDHHIGGRRPRIIPRQALHHRVEPREILRRHSNFRHRPDDRLHGGTEWDEDDDEYETQYYDDIEPSEFSYEGDSYSGPQGSFERRRSRNETSRLFPRGYRGHRRHGIDDDEFEQYDGGMSRVHGRLPVDRHRTGLYRGSPYNTMDTGYSDEL